MKKLPTLLLLVALAGHAHADVASDGSDGSLEYEKTVTTTLTPTGFAKDLLQGFPKP